MEKSSFFNSINRDRRYKAEDWAAYFSSFIGNGVFPLPTTGLQVVQNDGMTIALSAGKAWINGYFYSNESDLMLPLTVADGVLKRIDRIVIRWDLTARAISAQVKSSAPASNPVPPPLQRDADVWELCVADVLVNNGVTSITQNHITDQRLDDALCGIVAGVVQQIDTQTFNAQLQAWFEQYRLMSAAEFAALVSYFNDLKAFSDDEYAALLKFFDRLKQLSSEDYSALLEWFEVFKEKSENEFYTWFAILQDVLEENTATKLLQMILNNTGKIESETKAREKAIAEIIKMIANLVNETFYGDFSELDDIAVCAGKITNAAAGWCSHTFPREFYGVPSVTTQLMEENGYVMVNNVTSKGFQYQVRLVRSASFFTATAAAATATHSAQTLVTPPQTTAVPLGISYVAAYDGGI